MLEYKLVSSERGCAGLNAMDLYQLTYRARKTHLLLGKEIPLMKLRPTIVFVSV